MGTEEWQKDALSPHWAWESSTPAQETVAMPLGGIARTSVFFKKSVKSRFQCESSDFLILVSNV
jgi:hypothetical protein